MFGVGQVPLNDGSTMVALSVMTPVGQSLFFLDPKRCTELGKELMRQGREALTGITLPPNGLIVASDG
jgi:hypothetical protein